MADMVRKSPNPDGPQVFVPENIQNIGYATTSNGIPAIYFSDAEIQKLATNLYHAIVGKFSHSIPTSHQIQKALDNIKFCRGFTWKYINAKHILVQFEDMADYARLLSGLKGTPVWFIDWHPMRVFKWTPDFDAYCESPIAAIWCNLIGLPIHLFDQSALFAMGKLLGTPIQVDRATANKSRLSFARICVEIDITKSPPDEIILDICGRETVQQVKWDKIQSYCRECKHVGHKSDVCYAAGKMERPPKRNYNTIPPKQPQYGEFDTGRVNDMPRQNGNNSEWKQQEKNKGMNYSPRSHTKNRDTKESEWLGPDIMGDTLHGDDLEIALVSNEEERKNRPYHKQSRDTSDLGQPSKGERGGTSGAWNTEWHGNATMSDGQGRPRDPTSRSTREKTKTQEVSRHMSTNRY